MGEVITHGQRQLTWDPWGKLVKVTDSSFSWEASYDALGRRLQTRTIPLQGFTQTVTSFYDPEEEFREIGVCCNGQTLWKFYRGTACDALMDDQGHAVTLLHDILGNLIALAVPEETQWNSDYPSPYGPLTAPPQPHNLLSFAQTLTWQSQRVDPTGFVWLGARYYPESRIKLAL